MRTLKQMLAVGAVDSLSEARSIIAHSFPVEVFEPHPNHDWERAYQRLQSFLQ